MIEGLYESILTKRLIAQLAQALRKQTRFETLNTNEIADRLALHLSRSLIQAIQSLPEKSRVEAANVLVAQLFEKIAADTGAAIDADAPSVTDEYLAAIRRKNAVGDWIEFEQPYTPLLDTTLLTNAPNEPRVGSQLIREIDSADRIDIIMAFVRKSGLNPFIDALTKHTDRGGSLRLLTTTYTGSTEQRALEMLETLGGEVRVSYDLSSSRLHAKAWIFHRDTGFSTAFVGSSNMTHSAHYDGLEWNLRLSGVRNPDAYRKMVSMFESYWHGGDFRHFVAEEFASYLPKSSSGVTMLPPTEIRLEPFQERLLEQIELAREQGKHRNLMVAATGTGKTVMAAVDYVRLNRAKPGLRLLFVAHRKEILEQSLATFRHALRQGAFGELWVGSRSPTHYDHVFASIQSLTAHDIERIDPGHFDVVIVDEFHHACASTYDRLLNHLQPKELLGLTATPERVDGRSVLEWFEGDIAAELRLWDAIDQHRLVPFVYWGISDSQDLSKIPWRRGRGYDTGALTNLYTSTQAWANLVIQNVHDKVDDVEGMCALGFCVSVAHAEFMAHQFNAKGIVAHWLSGSSTTLEREQTLHQLAMGELRIVFSVDLFNEGFDLPAIDTILFLRPTDSATLFLQQLGRGLRRERNKAFCTVLDFVGRQHQDFRFDQRLRAVLRGTRKSIQRQVEQGFPYLPAGCQMYLDEVARKTVLDNIKESIPSTWRRKVAAMRSLLENDIEPTLVNYLEENGLTLDDVYAGNNRKCLSDLLQEAGVSMAPAGPDEKPLRRGIGRLLHIDDPERLRYYVAFLAAEQTGARKLPSNPAERRMLRMLIASLHTRQGWKPEGLDEAVAALFQHPQVVEELIQLFEYLATQQTHRLFGLSSHDQVPLKIHGRYNRSEIQAALDDGDVANAATPDWREGVKWLADQHTDVFLMTLQKSDGRFSPTTMYRDYAVSPEIIHWESQSTTSSDSPTGQRYIHHAKRGSTVLLFARLSTDDRGFWFLGPATYMHHEGNRPMGVTWRLHHPLPGDLYMEFGAAVA